MRPLLLSPKSLVMKMVAENAAYDSVPQKEKCEEPTSYPAPKGFGARHAQALILFICLTVGYSLRAHLSVSMVAMITPQHCHKVNILNLNIGEKNFAIVDFNNTDNEYTRAADNSSNIDHYVTEVDYLNNDSNFANNETSTTHDNKTNSVVATKYKEHGTANEVECEFQDTGLSVYRTYKWSKSKQEMILYSFFVGYTTMMIPMGIIAQKYGGKLPIAVALAANGVLSIITPWVPMFAGWLGICMVRLAQGLTQAAFYPSIHTMLGHWAPLAERGRLSTFVYSGSQFGTIIAFQLAGLFAGSPSLGWPAMFWLVGVASILCFGLLIKFSAATPHEHPGITYEELSFIMGDGSIDVLPKMRRTPWRAILTSPPVWGLIATSTASTLSFLFILTQIPMYMNKVLGVDIKRNGLLSSLPYIAMYLLSLGFGFLADYCVNKNYMTVQNVRRVSNTVGMAVSAAFLVGFSFIHNTVQAVILMILCLGAHSGVHVGFHINHIDLAPNFAGPIMSISNMLGNLTSLLGPVLVSNIIGEDVTNQRNWQILFGIIAALMVFTNMIFVVLVKGTVQPWNFHDDDYDEYGSCALKEKNTIVIRKESATETKT